MKEHSIAVIPGDGIQHFGLGICFPEQFFEHRQGELGMPVAGAPLGGGDFAVD